MSALGSETDLEADYDCIDLEAELATSTARVRLGTQQALKYIVGQYRCKDVQRALKHRLQEQLTTAASCGEDSLRIRDADFDRVSKLNVPDPSKYRRTPWYENGCAMHIVNPKDYNADCLLYGKFLHPQQVSGQRVGKFKPQPEWARHLYEFVKLNEEMRALSAIAQSLSVDLCIEYTDGCEYVFDWAKCARNSYYNNVKGPVDAFTQYDLIQELV